MPKDIVPAEPETFFQKLLVGGFGLMFLIMSTSHCPCEKTDWKNNIQTTLKTIFLFINLLLLTQ